MISIKKYVAVAELLNLFRYRMPFTVSADDSKKGNILQWLIYKLVLKWNAIYRTLKQVQQVQPLQHISFFGNHQLKL